MRILEIILTAALFFNILTLLSKSKKGFSVNFISLVLVAVVVILHLIVEGFRWQMIPTYMLAFLLLIRRVVSYSFLKLKTAYDRPSRLMLILYFLIMFGSLVAHILFPAIDLPETTEPYGVGTKYILQTDTLRAERSLINILGE